MESNSFSVLNDVNSGTADLPEVFENNNAHQTIEVKKIFENIRNAQGVEFTGEAFKSLLPSTFAGAGLMILGK
jgi:hypothetical protein